MDSGIFSPLMTKLADDTVPYTASKPDSHLVFKTLTLPSPSAGVGGSLTVTVA